MASDSNETALLLNMDLELAFKPGDVIQNYSDAFAKILVDCEKGKRCDTCFKRSPKVLRCSGCKLMYYCGTSCQITDWKEGHSFECKSAYFKKPSSNPAQPSDFKRQMCRLFAILKLHPGRGQKKFQMYDGTTRCFDDLLAHEAELSKDIRFELFLGDMFKSLEAEGCFAIDGGGKEVADLFRLAGVWSTNAFSILNETESQIIGSGIFVEPSYFDHSCKPTAFSNLQGSKMEVRAIGPIPKGEKPLVTYLAGHKTRKERQDLLKKRYNFECKCERCQLEETEDALDYKKLNNLITQASNTYDWKGYLKITEEILLKLRVLYHEYDERITNLSFLRFQELAGLGAPTNVLRKLANEAEDHLLTTFGKENPDVGKLLQQRAMHGIHD